MKPRILPKFPSLTEQQDEWQGDRQPALSLGHRYALCSTVAPIQTRSSSSPAINNKSKSIPCKGLKRTPSEVKLDEEEAMADFRDYVLFSRIVERVSDTKFKDVQLRQENTMSLAHLINTRNNATGKPQPQQQASYKATSTASYSFQYPPTNHNLDDLIDRMEQEEAMFELDM